MTVEEVLEEIKNMGSESTKKTFMRHGAQGPFYGVKVGDLKKIQKKVKKNNDLAIELYDTGVADAMYLAGLIAEPKKMSKNQLQKWAEEATWYMLSEYTVAWVAAESEYGWELASEWIDSDVPKIASSGWATLSSILSITPDSELDLGAVKKLLKRVEKEIEQSPNRVRYTMNGYVIAVGGYVEALTDDAIATAKRVGLVEVEMGGTACKVPDAVPYIQKMKDKGYIGKKRKTAVC